MMFYLINDMSAILGIFNKNSVTMSVIDKQLLFFLCGIHVFMLPIICPQLYVGLLMLEL